jgi:hypothetical protein
MNLTLPEPVREWVETQAARAVQPPEAFVLRVLFERMARDEESDFDEADEANGQPPTAEEIASAKRRLAELIREGIESGPAEPWTPEEWDAIRRGLRGSIFSQS